MPTANEALLDLVTHRSVNLMRFSEHVRRQVVIMLTDLKATLIQELEESDLDLMPTAAQRIRMEALLQQCNETIQSTYGDVSDYTVERLSDLAKSEGKFAIGALRMAIPVDLPTTAVGHTALEALADEAKVLGVPLKDWWAKQAEVTQAQFTKSIREGFLRGESVDDLVRRVRALEGEGGAGLALKRSHAETLVRSSVSTVANAARMATWKENEDLVKSIMWVSTLDTRTTIQFCIPRDHMLYDPVTLDPIGHHLFWRAGPGMIHPNCRSTSCPVLKSAKELGLDLPNLKPSTRASMDGQVPEATTYEEWLKKQPTSVQNDVLGVRKAEMWREGRIDSLQDLLNQRGRPLTIVELEERFPA